MSLGYTPSESEKAAQQESLKVKAEAGEIEVKEFNGMLYKIVPWIGGRTDSWGNNRACNCADLKRVVGMFCVCYGRAWCPTHSGPRCVGGHD